MAGAPQGSCSGPGSGLPGQMDGQESGTLLQLSAEKASAANLKPVLLEMKTQVNSWPQTLHT